MLPAAALLLTAASCSSGSTERPAPEIPLSGSESGEACLAWMQETLPECPEFEAWQDSTGILPPDFEALPSTNLLPDPFTFFDGGKVRTDVRDWELRRKELLSLFEDCMWGHFPPKPEISRVEVLEEDAGEGWKSRTVKLLFGPEDKGNVRVKLTIPVGTPSPDGKYPLMLSTTLDGQGNVLLSRGYISAGFAGSDFMDDSANLTKLYPDYDFAKLSRRAWLVSIVLDYFETVPEIDMDRIAVYGYSRDGKMMSIATARDERISALVAGSTGVGGFVPWRYSGERNGGESIESTTRMFPDWFIPQLRYFSGREDRLPVDANLLLAVIAPRAVLMEWGYNDEVASGWAQERAYESALPVYELYSAADRLGMLKVPGFHGSNDMQACVDFLDIQFGFSDGEWKYEPAYSWDFDEWKSRSGVSLDPLDRPEHQDAPVADIQGWESRRQDIRASVEDMLGEKPVRLEARPSARALRSRSGAGPGPMEFSDMPYNPGQLEPDVPAWVIYLLIALVVIAAGIYAYWRWGRKAKGGEAAAEEKAIPPYERAIQALHELKDSKLWQQGQEKAYYTNLTEILRVYIDQRFHINAMEMTSTQIIDTLRRNEETKAVNQQLRDILEMADFVKFAKMRPLPDDNEQVMRYAENFVEETKPEEKAPEQPAAEKPE